MPKLWQKYVKSGILGGLWLIDESEEELKSQLEWMKPEEFRNANRSIQWLASRVLMQEMLAHLNIQTAVLSKDLNGKPSINIPGLHVSISHNPKYTAVAIAEVPVGVDVELIHPRIERVKDKFMNPHDYRILENESDIAGMHLIWSAKEAMFKYHPMGELDFRSHLYLEKIGEGVLQGTIQKENEKHALLVPYEYLPDGILVWAYAAEEAGIYLP